MSKSRKKAKTEFLKTLYLGNIKLYSDAFNDTVEGDITEEGYRFLQELQKEVEVLALMVWEQYPAFHKLKLGKEKQMISKRSNPKASLMSLIFQTKERHILMVWNTFLESVGRSLAVFIHDGGLVEKLESESYFPPDLLEKGSKLIFENLGYKVHLTQKDIKYEWKPYKPQESQYEVMISLFE